MDEEGMKTKVQNARMRKQKRPTKTVKIRIWSKEEEQSIQRIVDFQDKNINLAKIVSKFLKRLKPLSWRDEINHP